MLILHYLILWQGYMFFRPPALPMVREWLRTLQADPINKARQVKSSQVKSSQVKQADPITKARLAARSELLAGVEHHV